MSRHDYGRSPKPWSKLKSRVEALFAPCRPSPTSTRGIACGDGLPLAVHCNVFVKVTKEFTFDEPRHWVVLGRGRAGRIIWDFPGPFLRTKPGEPPRSARGPPLERRSGRGGSTGSTPTG